MQPGWCPAPQNKGRTKEVLLCSYGNERNDLGVSVTPYKWSSFTGSSPYREHTVTGARSAVRVTSSHTCVTLACANLPVIDTVLSAVSLPLGSHRVEPEGGNRCGSTFALQDLNQWCQMEARINIKSTYLSRDRILQYCFYSSNLGSVFPVVTKRHLAALYIRAVLWRIIVRNVLCVTVCCSWSPVRVNINSVCELISHLWPNKPNKYFAHHF